MKYRRSEKEKEQAKKIVEEKKKIQEARTTLKKPYDFGNGIELVSYGMSPNGNHTVTIILPNGKKKSIQTNNPGLFSTHRILVGSFKSIDQDDLDTVKKELSDWIKKYESVEKEKEDNLREGWEPDIYIDLVPSDLENMGSVTDDRGKTEYVFKHKKYDKYYRTQNGVVYALAKTGRPSSKTNLTLNDVRDIIEESIKEESDDIKNQKMKINDLENDLLQAEKDEDKEKADGLKKDIEAEKETLKSMQDSEKNQVQEKKEIKESLKFKNLEDLTKSIHKNPYLYILSIEKDHIDRYGNNTNLLVIIPVYEDNEGRVSFDTSLEDIYDLDRGVRTEEVKYSDLRKKYNFSTLLKTISEYKFFTEKEKDDIVNNIKNKSKFNTEYYLRTRKKEVKTLPCICESCNKEYSIPENLVESLNKTSCPSCKEKGKMKLKENKLKENEFSDAIEYLKTSGMYMIKGYKFDDAIIGKIEQYLEKEKIDYIQTSQTGSDITFYTSFYPAWDSIIRKYEGRVLKSNRLKEDIGDTQELPYIYINDDIRKKIVDFFSNVKVTKDEEILHGFAKAMFMNPHQLEEEVYSILQCFLMGGKAKEKGVTSEDVDVKEYMEGSVIELEHFDSENPYSKFLSPRVALDHFAEIDPPKDSEYYSFLKKMEKKVKEEADEEKEEREEELESMFASEEMYEKKFSDLKVGDSFKWKGIRNTDEFKITKVEDNKIEFEPSKDTRNDMRTLSKTDYEKASKDGLLLEAEDKKDYDVKKMIKDLQGNFAGDDEKNMKASQILKGLLLSDDPKAKAFVKKLDTATTEISKEVLGESKKESIETKESDLPLLENITYKEFIEQAKETYGDLVTKENLEDLLETMIEAVKEIAVEDVKEKLDFLLEEVNKPEEKLEEGVAETILAQLGGNKFTAMTGAKNYSKGTNKDGNEYLNFRLPKADKGINNVQIALTGRDTYDITYGKIRGTNYDIIATYKDVYADDLKNNFEQVTKLYTSL